MQGSSPTRASRSPAVAANILLLRHAATIWNEQGRRLGWADQPLAAAGRRTARMWTRDPSVEFATVVSSDLARAHETAQILAAALGAPEVTKLAGLREQDQGEWTGLTKEQIKQRWPERARERPRRPIGGEEPEAVVTRAVDALEEIARTHAGGAVLAVTHNGVIHLIERALGIAAPPIAPLEGRWVRVLESDRGDGGRGIASLRPGELTGGRHVRAGAEGAAAVAAG